MKLLQMRLPLFICLLLFLSTAKANNSSSQNSFEFLNITLENATFVEDKMTLLKNTVLLIPTAVINTGIWWAVCKARGLISMTADKNQYIDLDKQGDGSIEPDFCFPLAQLIATTETTLAGQVSPWPLDPLMWRSVFLMGAVLTAHSRIANHQMQVTPQGIAPRFWLIWQQKASHEPQAAQF